MIRMAKLPAHRRSTRFCFNLNVSFSKRAFLDATVASQTPKTTSGRILMLRNKLFCAEIDMDALQDTISKASTKATAREKGPDILGIVSAFAAPIAVVW